MWIIFVLLCTVVFICDLTYVFSKLPATLCGISTRRNFGACTKFSINVFCKPYPRQFSGKQQGHIASRCETAKYLLLMTTFFFKMDNLFLRTLISFTGRIPRWGERYGVFLFKQLTVVKKQYLEIFVKGEQNLYSPT